MSVINDDKNKKKEDLKIEFDDNQSIHSKKPVKPGMDEGINLYGFQLPKVEGDKAIKCWNCESLLMVKSEWKVVQCPTCEKICKIPNDKPPENSQIRLNNNMNHMNLNMPYVYAIIICPFCKTDNKVRSNSEHMICFRCHNSMNVVKEKNTNTISINTDKSHFNYGKVGTAPQKSVRFSDMFFPDPMYFPGFYPIGSSYSPLYPQNDPAEIDAYYRRKLNYEMFKHHIEKSKEQKNKHIKKPIMERLSQIRNSLQLESINTFNNLNNSEKNYINNNNNIETGFENKINDIKNRLLNSKKNKNQAIYNSLVNI
jgi:hypothetical protein